MNMGGSARKAICSSFFDNLLQEQKFLVAFLYMAESPQSVVSLLNPQHSRVQPLTVESIREQLTAEDPAILDRVRVQQLENSRRIRIDFTEANVPVLNRTINLQMRQYGCSYPSGDSRTLPDYIFSDPEESFGPTVKLLRSANNVPMPKDLSERLEVVITHIFASNMMWQEEGKQTRTAVMLGQLCKAHPEAPKILFLAAQKWNEELSTNEYSSDEEIEADFAVINRVLQQNGQTTIVPIKQVERKPEDRGINL